jgi:hypothetical protein
MRLIWRGEGSVTVYVDDMEAEFKPGHVPNRRYVMCHMITDDPTFEELHRMADTIGVDRKWFQGDHYDIVKTKRALAVKAGAVEITVRQCAVMAMDVRRGRPMRSPAEAQAELERRRRVQA